jgi:hypothetical protein
MKHNDKGIKCYFEKGLNVYTKKEKQNLQTNEPSTYIKVCSISIAEGLAVIGAVFWTGMKGPQTRTIAAKQKTPIITKNTYRLPLIVVRLIIFITHPSILIELLFAFILTHAHIVWPRVIHFGLLPPWIIFFIRAFIV